jgi:endonuclease III
MVPANRSSGTPSRAAAGATSAKQAKARRIQGILDGLYPHPEIPLDHGDSYTLLIAVLLSAQCTDVRVNSTTPKLFARAARPQDMVKLSQEEIREIIKPCGLSPAKSKAILELSRLLLERHGGLVPGTFEELEALPGVGHKTASAVLVHAFDTPAFPVDTHIHRLAARWGLSDGSSVEQTERDLKPLFPERDWGRVHLQIIWFGRERCPALRHDFATCPICSWAAAKTRASQEKLRQARGMRRPLARVKAVRPPKGSGHPGRPRRTGGKKSKR